MTRTEYRTENNEFLKKKLSEEGVKELSNGVLYKILEEGTGKGTVKFNSIVTCHYKGSLVTGTVFDDSFKRTVSEAFKVNSLISGFQTALINMHIGDHWEVYIPYKEGYGTRNCGPIPGYSTLIFEILLVGIA
ncbi:MAG: FKBP-type peptidyl-prolyl cis-trans isomerase [Bacteroidales bacterium]|nr:FKBP-type peptidyl-prolyl cis-trans isomerase [Bacteroidales bacterium]